MMCYFMEGFLVYIKRKEATCIFKGSFIFAGHTCGFHVTLISLTCGRCFITRIKYKKITKKIICTTNLVSNYLNLIIFASI